MTELYESDDANVSHPKHYQSRSGLEVIDVIEAFTEDLDGIYAVDTANILKYACRWKHKNGKQDVEKIIWYATHLLKCLERTPIAVATRNDRCETNTADSELVKLRTPLHSDFSVSAKPAIVDSDYPNGMKYTE